MPQMAPMPWMMIMVMVISTMMMMISMNHFTVSNIQFCSIKKKKLEPLFKW
uniref:ATP synthase F0 subunit 8 n=1 Tax=Dimorphostylis asiatica TaxID=2840398 RepID=A0A8F8FFQ4_9CRUS|nr:ATP synthase F0 subunit 8 [Dimorphostylis asiatica]